MLHRPVETAPDYGKIGVDGCVDQSVVELVWPPVIIARFHAFDVLLCIVIIWFNNRDQEIFAQEQIDVVRIYVAIRPQFDT
ncbi:MAG: hypothetical protein WBZ37_23470, partial [Mycobacterium sp.]